MELEPAKVIMWQFSDVVLLIKDAERPCSK